MSDEPSLEAAPAPAAVLAAVRTEETRTVTESVVQDSQGTTAASGDATMADGTRPVDATVRLEEEAPSSSSLAAGAPASSAEDDMPPAAQQQRPVTPPRPSPPNGHPSSSSSSQHTITAHTATTRPSQPTSTLHLTQTELADDSPDPLRIIPTPSAASASSAAAAARYRSRSAATRSPSAGPSTAPPGPGPQSSPTHPRTGGRSKTPAASHDTAGEHLDAAPPSSSAPAAAVAPRRRGSRAPSNADSDDELGFGSSAPPQPAGAAGAGAACAGRRVSQFECVEITVGPGSGPAGAHHGGSSSGSARVPAAGAGAGKGAAQATGGRKTKASPEVEGGRKRTRYEQNFEVVLPAPRSRQSSRSPPNSPRSSPNPASTSTVSGPPATTPAPARSQASPHAPAQPHPLSQSLSADIAPSSPLTSLPPSGTRRTSPAAPASAAATSESARSKRPRRSVAAAAAAVVEEGGASDDGDDDEGTTARGGSSSATERAASPPAKRKKREPEPRKRRAPPLVKKQGAAAAVAKGRKVATGGKGRSKGKEREREEEEGTESEASSEEEEEEEEEEEVRDKGKKGARGAKRLSEGKGKGKEKKGAVAARDVSTVWDEDEALKHFVVEANRGTRRRASGRATLKEVSSSSSGEGEDATESDEDTNDDSDEFVVSKPRASPKKRGRPPTKAKTGPSSGGTPKQRAKAVKRAPAKGKEKQKAKEESAPPTSSPSKSSWLPPPGSFGSQLLGHDRAPVESSQQRSQGWSLNALPRDRPVWAHVRKEDQGGFWWPARLDCAHWEKPLRVKLYLDTAASILEFTTETITFDSPDHDDLATFRNPTKLRFDKHTFRDSADGASPSNDAFDRVLETAIVTDAGLDDEDDEEALLPPSSLGTSGAKASSQSREQEGNESSSSEEKGVKELVEEEDEEWLEGGGEDAGMTFPFVCLARDKRTWWAARAARYEPPPSPTKNGAKRAVSGKFVVEWTDGSYGKVTRKNLLTPTDPAFFTVKLGETELDIPKSYIPKLREFCTTSLPKRFQKVIDEDLALAQPFNDAFFAGGFKRDQLAKKSAFGEMSSEALAVVEDSISRWARGELSDDGERPHGSPRYEALEPSERSQYGVDVLLSIAVALNYVDDEGLAERAEAQLKERGVDEPSEDAVEEEAFKIARGELDLRSATKTVLAMRQLRQINDASRKQKAKESRTKSR